MARPSPGTRRVISLLKLLAIHPGTAFSLTDIVKALKMNRATCHSLLAELVDTGFLYRTSDKLYLLGPAAAELGRAASNPLPPVHVVRPEARALADMYDVVCVAVSREHNDVVHWERAASASHLDRPPDAWLRIPLRPPFAGVFLAWTPEGEVEAWLDRLMPAPTAGERRRTHEQIAFVRRHGFQFAVTGTLDPERRRRLAETQGILILRQLRAAGVALPAVLFADLDDDQRRFLEQTLAPLAIGSSHLGIREIGALLRGALGRR
jgi:DNA-binding IclR family transcriptional regulator